MDQSLARLPFVDRPPQRAAYDVLRHRAAKLTSGDLSRTDVLQNGQVPESSVRSSRPQRDGLVNYRLRPASSLFARRPSLVVTQSHFVDLFGGRSTGQQVLFLTEPMSALRSSRCERLRLNRSQTPCFRESRDSAIPAYDPSTRQLYREPARSVLTILLPENLFDLRDQFTILRLPQGVSAYRYA